MYLKAHQMENVFHPPLREYLSLMDYEPGELICSKGEQPQYLYVLMKGKIKIHTSSAEGKTLILSFKSPLEAIGDIEYIQGAEFLNTVQAVTPVTMIAIHHRWLNKYGKEHPPLLQFLLEIITQKFYIKSNLLSFNLMYPVEVRLASYLLSVSVDDSDVLITGNRSVFNLLDVANLIGTSYRHLNRVMQKFGEEGLVERHRGFIRILDKERLRAIANHNIYE
nr:Crp/Fnr family transcriptional regulator [Paenibacillus shirakamiensis]